MVKCEICGKAFETDRSLHAHLKAHKITVVDYYQKYFPRFDLYDGNPIEYKSKEQYFDALFNSPRNFKRWRDEKPMIEVRSICLGMIRKRIKKKNMEYSMCQVELRSLRYPAINELNRIFGDYYDLCKELGLKNKYKKTFLFKDKQRARDSIIYIDTREKNPLKFKTKTESKGLKFGDYALSTENKKTHMQDREKIISRFRWDT